MKAKVYNSLLAWVIATGMIVSFYYLERAFRGGDTRRAVQAVQAMRLKPNGPTLLQDLQQQYGEDASLTWFAEIESSYKGLIRVICRLPNHRIRTWRVDVLTGRISEL